MGVTELETIAQIVGDLSSVGIWGFVLYLGHDVLTNLLFYGFAVTVVIFVARSVLEVSTAPRIHQYKLDNIILNSGVKRSLSNLLSEITDIEDKIKDKKRIKLGVEPIGHYLSYFNKKDFDWLKKAVDEKMERDLK